MAGCGPRHCVTGDTPAAARSGAPAAQRLRVPPQRLRAPPQDRAKSHQYCRCHRLDLYYLHTPSGFGGDDIKFARACRNLQRLQQEGKVRHAVHRARHAHGTCRARVWQAHDRCVACARVHVHTRGVHVKGAARRPQQRIVRTARGVARRDQGMHSVEPCRLCCAHTVPASCVCRAVSCMRRASSAVHAVLRALQRCAPFRIGATCSIRIRPC